MAKFKVGDIIRVMPGPNSLWPTRDYHVWAKITHIDFVNRRYSYLFIKHDLEYQIGQINHFDINEIDATCYLSDMPKYHRLWVTINA